MESWFCPRLKSDQLRTRFLDLTCKRAWEPFFAIRSKDCEEPGPALENHLFESTRDKISMDWLPILFVPTWSDKNDNISDIQLNMRIRCVGKYFFSPETGRKWTNRLVKLLLLKREWIVAQSQATTSRIITMALVKMDAVAGCARACWLLSAAPREACGRWWGRSSSK